MKIGILTCKNFPNLSSSDQLLIPSLLKRNIIAKPVIWNDHAIDWNEFDLLLFRNTWDYYEKQTEFDTWLLKIEKLGIKTLNTINVVNQNKHKFYLKELQNYGIKIIPTIFIEKTNKLNLIDVMPNHWKTAVIKPAYSAGSYLTELFEKSNVELVNKKYKSIAAEKELLLQKYMPEIKTLGETSLVFFDKKFSHAVNKQAINDDFRIQQQYGGIYKIVEVTDEIINQAQKIINIYPENLLYARVDGIIIDDELHLMEVECLEPDLYFNLAAGSIDKFVDAILRLIS
ncbi:MAG: hypothetical protein H7174_10855 [Flavobacterium sp.]|nr:hypothetical protein [Flavobacterium sp.]